MNASTKVFSILSLAAAIGKILEKSKAEDHAERINWRGSCLHRAGFKAVSSYPFPSMTDNKVKQVGAKVEEVCKSGEEFDIVETLSFLMVGLVDIWSNVNDSNKVFIDPVIRRVRWCMDLFCGDGTHDEAHVSALKRYEEWVR